MNEVFSTTADALVIPESSNTDVSATDATVGFTVLGEVKPKTFRKVYC